MCHAHKRSRTRSIYYFLLHVSSWKSFGHLNSTSSKPSSLPLPLKASSPCLSLLSVNIMKLETCQQSSPSTSLFLTPTPYGDLSFWLLTIPVFLSPYFHCFHLGPHSWFQTETSNRKYVIDNRAGDDHNCEAFVTHSSQEEGHATPWGVRGKHQGRPAGPGEWESGRGLHCGFHREKRARLVNRLRLSGLNNFCWLGNKGCPSLSSMWPAGDWVTWMTAQSLRAR